MNSLPRFTRARTHCADCLHLLQDKRRTAGAFRIDFTNAIIVTVFLNFWG